MAVAALLRLLTGAWAWIRLRAVWTTVWRVVVVGAWVVMGLAPLAPPHRRQLVAQQQEVARVEVEVGVGVTVVLQMGWVWAPRLSPGAQPVGR